MDQMDPEEIADITPAPVPAEEAPEETVDAPETQDAPAPEAPAPDAAVSEDAPTNDESPVIEADDIVARVAPDPALQINGSLPQDSAIIINR